MISIEAWGLHPYEQELRSLHTTLSGLLILISILCAFSYFFLLHVFKGFLFMAGCQGIEPRLAPHSGGRVLHYTNILVPAATDRTLYGRYDDLLVRGGTLHKALYSLLNTVSCLRYLL